MKKGVVFLPGTGLPHVVDVGDHIDLSEIAKKLGFEWCEIVRPVGLKGKFVMIVDEEGLLKERPVRNIIGSYWYGGTIAGNLMVLKEVMGPEGPELAGLDEADIEKVMNLLPVKWG